MVLWIVTPGVFHGTADGRSMFLQNTDTLMAWCHDPEEHIRKAVRALISYIYIYIHVMFISW